MIDNNVEIIMVWLKILEEVKHRGLCPDIYIMSLIELKLCGCEVKPCSNIKLSRLWILTVKNLQVDE